MPLKYAEIHDADAALTPDGRMAQMRSSPFRLNERLEKGIRSPYLIVDFGRPIFGFPRLRVVGPRGGTIEMTYGVDLVNGRPMPLLGGVPYGDQYVMKAGDQTWQVFEYKAFRYVEIVFRNVDASVSIDSITAISYEYPAERKGSFECSDDALTKLWKACIDTTYLQMEDTLVCDAIRERLPWTGDGGHGLYGIFAGFGDIALTRWYFRLLSRGRLTDGMLRIYYPGTEPLIGGKALGTGPSVYENPLNIPQFALLYVIFVAEHYSYFGDKQLLDELYPTLAGVGEWCYRHRDDKGLLYSLSNLNFVDWIPTEMTGANLETNALYFKMLQDLSTLARELGKSDEASKWKRQGSQVCQSIRHLYWNNARGLYADSIIDDKQSARVTELSNSFVVLFGVATAEQKARILGNLISPPSDLMLATPLYYYYVSEALVRGGATEQALNAMEKRYALMLQASDTPTIREFWSPYVRPFSSGGEIHNSSGEYTGQLASPIHSGGVGAAWTLSKHILGVYPMGAGFKRCRIEPNTASHLKWARGVFPSVRGDIRVQWRRDERGLTMDVVLPRGLESELVLTRPKTHPTALIYDQQKYLLTAVSEDIGPVHADATHITIRVNGGAHKVRVGRHTN